MIYILFRKSLFVLIWITNDKKRRGKKKPESLPLGVAKRILSHLAVRQDFLNKEA